MTKSNKKSKTCQKFDLEMEPKIKIFFFPYAFDHCYLFGFLL